MRHRPSPLPASLTVLAGLCFAATLCFASPPKLYFEKDLDQRPARRYAYQIKKGDHVYQILRRFKISSELRPRILQRTRELNPHIEDLDKIEPGQIVYFPQSVKKHAEFTVPEVPDFESPVPTATYTVRSGEHLGQILRQKVGLPNHLIFGQYLDLFRKLNPHIEDPDRLEVGQRITLPLPPERQQGDIALFSPAEQGAKAAQQQKAVQNGKGKQATGDSEQTVKESGGTSSPQPAPEAKPKPEHKKRRLVLNILRVMGFSPSAEEKILYPSQEGGWVHIDLDRTPILETPWGRSLLLVPDQYATSLIRSKLERTDLRSCRVEDSWSPTQVFQNLQDATKSRLIFWSPGESLILNFRGMVLEMQGRYQFVIKAEGQPRYHLFLRAPLDQERVAGQLAGFLEQKNIHFHTIANTPEGRELRRVQPVSADSSDAPRFSFANIWPRVANTLSSGNETPKPPGNRNAGTLLNYLQDRDLAEKENLRLEFLHKAPLSTSVVLTLRATRLQLKPPAVMLPEERADPHLFRLLRLAGYDAYSLGP